jgi:hypothetical protein
MLISYYLKTVPYLFRLFADFSVRIPDTTKKILTRKVQLGARTETEKAGVFTNKKVQAVGRSHAALPLARSRGLRTNFFVKGAVCQWHTFGTGRIGPGPGGERPNFTSNPAIQLNFSG